VRLIDRTETVIVKGEPITSRTQFWDFTEEVFRGADFLDRHLGADWHQDLELEGLDLSSGTSCVLGQLAMTRFRDELREHYQRSESEEGDDRCDCGCDGGKEDDDYLFQYEDVVKMLASTEDPKWAADSTGLPASHGFFVNDNEIDVMLKSTFGDVWSDEREYLRGKVSWEHLTWAWMDVIRSRRKKQQIAADDVNRAVAEAAARRHH